MHNAAVSLRDAEAVRVKGIQLNQPAVTAINLLQILHRKADDRNVPSAVSFISHLELADQLVREGYYEQAIMLRCLARSEMA